MKTHLVADLQAPAAARRFVRDQLDVLAPSAPTLRDEVTLIVSELVTNSVRAGAGAVDVELRVDEARLDLHVTDDAPGWPSRRTASAEDLAGRGLEIVEQLADSWHTISRSPGKSVVVTRFWDR